VAAAPTAARRLRADLLEGTMPTEAKRQAVAALREHLTGSHTLIVSE
jgi:hypothetical protein